MSILKNSAVVGGWTFASRILGFVRDIVLANKLGASAVSDAFFIALILPNLLRRLFAEGAFNVAFVPIFSRLREKNKLESQQFVNIVFTWLALILISITVVAEIFMPYLVTVLAPGFLADADKFALTVTLARVTFPYLFLISIASLLGALCNTVGKFMAWAAVPALLNISLISCLFLLPQFGVTSAMSATLAIPIGGVLQLVFMVVAFRKTDIKLQLVSPTITPKLKEMGKRILPAALGVGVLQISFLVDTFLASILGGNAVSYLQYANRFYQLPLALIGTALATVLLPYFSKALKNKNSNIAGKAFADSVIVGLALALASMVGLIFLADKIMLVMLAHGEFTLTASHASAMALVAYSLGLPAYILTKVTSTGFFAMGDTKTPMKTAIIALIINILANLILMQYFGYVGIALATAISAWVNASLQWYILQNNNTNFKVKNVLKPCFKFIILAICMFAGLKVFAYFFVFGESLFLQIMWLCGAIGLSLLIFLGGGFAILKQEKIV